MMPQGVGYQTAFGPGWLLVDGGAVLELGSPGSDAPAPVTAGADAAVTHLAADLEAY